MFLFEGLGIAVAGSVTGAIAGIAVVYLLSLPKQTARVGGIPESLFPLMLDPLNILAVMGASKINPVDAMR